MVARIQRAVAVILAACGLCHPRGAVLAQVPYFNTDAGRPLRIEDAIPVERYAVDFEVPAARMERLDAGVTRWRVEPDLSYGILPRTEIELRSTFVYREATAEPRGGLSSFELSVMHALNTETARLPAVAVAAEIFQPAGAARTGGTAYSVRALVTRSSSFGRWHLNASYGSYNVGVVQPASVCVYGPNFNIPCTGSGPTFPFIPDGPCLMASAPSAMMCQGTPPSTAKVSAASDTVPLRGTHWLAGLAFDHAFALHSTLLMADIFAERYVGLYSLTDWTAEVGVRRQFTPTLGLDAGVGRHFLGTSPSWIVTFGATYSAPLHRFRHRPS
jgi:hypothetical protein